MAQAESTSIQTSEANALLTLDCMLFLDSVEVSDGSMEDFKRLNAELLAPEWELQ